MKNIKQWLIKNGYTFREYDDCIMVNTDYEGWFAPSEIYYTHNKISAYINRCHRNFYTESRGSHTGLLIAER